MKSQSRLFVAEKRYDSREIIRALSCLRSPVVIEETDLYRIIAEKLDQAGIPYIREYRLGPRGRIDFMIPGGIGLETKKGKPDRKHVIHQLERYCGFPVIKEIVLITERFLEIPCYINKKRCTSLSLNKLWGVAL